jgi:hypothetical protein
MRFLSFSMYKLSFEFNIFSGVTYNTMSYITNITHGFFNYSFSCSPISMINFVLNIPTYENNRKIFLYILSSVRMFPT